MNFSPRIDDHSDQTLEEQILAWMEALGRPGKNAPGQTLACELSAALERFMGIERELLFPLLLSAPRSYIG